ncbi:MAG: YitT family protein [Ruminococcus sp.]
MSKAETLRRYILFIISLFIAALGVAFTKHAGLGVSPVSSIANVMNLKVPSVSLGTWLIIYNCILILGQIAVLRRKFQLLQLLQVPLSFLFGWFTDIGMKIAGHINAEYYPVRLLLCLSGIIILGFGISLSVIANVIMNSGEAFVKAVSDTLDADFGTVKIAFDVTNVTLSILLSLVFFNFTIAGTREGTVMSALLTGVFVKFFRKRLHKPLDSILSE